MTYTFSEAEAEYAYRAWGANCGPTALAFALQVPLEEVRPHIPNFAERRYTSPTMIAAALESLKRRVIKMTARSVDIGKMFNEWPALVRIQWGGPWIVNGKPQKWAARQTHWICCWADAIIPMVFDVNCGIREYSEWVSDIVPALDESVPRCDGGWYPSNVWRILP